MDIAERPGLFTRALHGSASAPLWFEDIFFGEMVMKLQVEQRKDLLLDVDVRALAAWLGLQDMEWQRAFVAQMSPAMATAVRNNSGFSSRAEQLRLARRGHQEIVRALKSQYAKGRASFLDLVA
jgi:hypothetical protein